jgi:hypothetical protein
LLLKQKLFQVDWNGSRDSSGSSGTGETHAGVYVEEAQRRPAESEHLERKTTTPYFLVNSNKVYENSQKNNCVYLMNCARGGIIDEAGLIHYLKTVM